MLARIFRQWKLFPITSMLVVISIALYVATRVYLETGPPAQNPGRTPAAQQAQLMDTLVLFGAVGLKKVWAGEWWRLLVSGFHHGFMLHLVGNVIAVALMGRLIEPEFPRWWFLLFCLGSLVLTVSAEALTGTAAVGISGTGCAMLGLIIVQRRRDPELAWMVPPSAVWMGVLSLIAGIPLGSTGSLPIANIAHFSGLGYGLIVGLVAGLRRRGMSHGLFVVMHAGLVPLVLLAMQPSWTDTYKAMLIDQERGDLGRKIRLIEEVLGANPERTYYRSLLADSLFLEERRDEAWRVALEGWSGTDSPGQRGLARLIQQLWSRLRNADERERYEAVIDELYADKAEWAKLKLDLAWHSVRSRTVEEYLQNRAMLLEREREPDPTENLPSPDSETSAALGGTG